MFIKDIRGHLVYTDIRYYEIYLRAINFFYARIIFYEKITTEIFKKKRGKNEKRYSPKISWIHLGDRSLFIENINCLTD